VWGVKEWKDMPVEMPRLSNGLGMIVTGRAALWGRLIEHEKGFRAQYGYPYEIFVPSLKQKAAQVLRRMYGCDVWTIEQAGEPGGPLYGDRGVGPVGEE
jgi:hypothetical protein